MILCVVMLSAEYHVLGVHHIVISLVVQIQYVDAVVSF